MAEHFDEIRHVTDDFLSAIQQLKLAHHHIKMLQAHYHSPGKIITATQMAAAMGYSGHRPANLHYGKLGKLIGEKLLWKPLPKLTVNVLVTFKKPGAEWLWIMRPQVAQSMEMLGWVGIKNIAIPEEIENPAQLPEGAVKTILINAYERNPVARARCIEYYGHKCTVCGICLENVYGKPAKSYIHVHHLRQLSEINKEYQVDPIKDLRPVCPNCHSIIHKQNPAYTIEEVKSFIKQ